jgi:hypothetical protein
MFTGTTAFAQVSLSGSSYTENFDGMGTSGTTAPTGWTTRTSATSSARGTAAGALSVNATTSTTGAFNNYPNGSGRCLGVRQTGTLGDPGAAFELVIANTTGKTGFALTMDHLMLNVQTRSTTWTIQYSLNGTSWTSLGTYTDPGVTGTTAGSYSFGTGIDNKSSNVYIRIVALAASSGSGSRDAYGIDNFSLTWSNASSCSAPATSSVSNINTTSADISWGSVSGATGYEYQVTTSSSTPSSGTASSTTAFTANSLTAGTKYYIHLRTACSGGVFSSWKTDSFTTTSVAAPDITITGNSLSFGTVVSGTASAEKTYTVSGSNLSSDIQLSAPADFSISLTSGSSYTSSLTLAQSGGTVSSTTIYVIYTPSSATGSVSAGIDHTSSGASTEQVTLAATAISTEPATSGTVSFGTVTLSDMVINFSGGDGARRIVAVRPSGAVSYEPADGAAVSGVNSVFTSATDQGNSNRVVYDGTAATVTVTGLTAGTTYHVAVYEYNMNTGNSQNYKTTSPATASTTTLEEAIYLTGTLASTYTENFNTIGTSSTASLPSGFQVSGATASPVYGSSVTTATTQAFGSTGTGAVSSGSAGGFINWANGVTSSSTDRSLGLLSSGGYASPRSLMTKVRNATGNTITSVLITYDVEKFRSGSRAMNVKSYYSLNGSTWVLIKTTAYAADAGNTTIYNPPAATAEEGLISGISIAADAAIYLRWEFEGVGGSTNSQGIGVDNITITPFSVTRLTGNTDLANGSYDNLNVVDAATLGGDASISGRIHFASDSKLSLNGHTLTINGTISGSVTIEGGSGSSLIISGSGSLPEITFDQSVPGTSNRLKDFGINRSGATITLGNALEITGTVTPTSGTLASWGNLLLVSDASGTARIGTIGASADITGNVTVQRYVPAVTRRSRTLSSPVSNFAFNQYIDDMYLSGAGGATNGFDASPANGNSIFTYQESNGGSGRGWKAITHIDNTLDAGLGALVFVRGDRNIGSQWYAAPYPSQNEVTIDYASQPINKGDVSPAVTYTSTGSAADDGWNLLGNPYPSPIDWTLLTKQNLGPFYYTFDPLTGSYVADDGTALIASGQAFFVQAIAASPSITFTESAKASGTPVNYFKTQQCKIAITMTRDNLNSDKAWLVLKQDASRGYVPSEDALKFTNSLINLSFYIDSNTAAQVNASPINAQADTFMLNTSAPAGSYWLKFANLASVSSALHIYLYDRVTQELTDLRLTDSIAFVIPAANHDQNRFSIILSNHPQALPVKLISFGGVADENETTLSWTVAEEKNIASYTVQYSPDGHTFTEIGKVKANNKGITKQYSYVEPVRANDAYYRLAIEEYNGSVTLSREIIVQQDFPVISLTKIYPNPVMMSNNATLTYTLVRESDVQITLVSCMGEKLWNTSKLQVPGEHVLELPAQPAGVYYLVFKTALDEKVLKLIVQ